MKKKLILISQIFILLFSVNLFAMDFMIGAKGGYYVWRPFFRELDAAFMNDIEDGQGALYGPIFSLIITPDISISAAVLTGKQSAHWYSPNQYDPDLDLKKSGTYFVDTKRTDYDSAISYRIIRNLKIFVGYKYHDIKSKFTYTERRYGDNEKVVHEQELNIKTPSHGPALGIGLSFPIGNYFIAANISGLYMKGELEVKGDMYSYQINPEEDFEDPALGEPYKESSDIKQLGFNFEPTIGFKAGSNFPIVTLGFRYQLLRTKFLDDFEVAPEDGGYINDHLYGAFVSVILVF